MRTPSVLRLFALGLLLAGAMTSCSGPSPRYPDLTPAERACADDRDCVAVEQAGCCPSCGWARQAMNQAAWRRRQDACNDIDCSDFAFACPPETERVQAMNPAMSSSYVLPLATCRAGICTANAVQ